jgi:hypothetical protein
MMRKAISLLALLLLSACAGAPTATLDLNPTVPPATPSPPAPLSLENLPTLPDALTITPGDRFSVQTTPSSPAQVEAYYTDGLAAWRLTLSARQEHASGLFGNGLLLTYTGDGISVYVMIMPDFENQATGVLLALDRALFGEDG